MEIIRKDGYFVTVPNTQKFIRTKGYYIRKRLPDGRLGSVHIINWEKANGRKVPDGYIVNHKNGIKTDNRPQNLEIIPAYLNIWLNHNFFDNKQTRAARRNGTLLGPGKRVRK